MPQPRAQLNDPYREVQGAFDNYPKQQSFLAFMACVITLTPYRQNDIGGSCHVWTSSALAFVDGDESILHAALFCDIVRCLICRATMIDVEDINTIFSKITEEFETPVPIGSRCESSVFYRVEDLTDDDLNICAEYVAGRIRNVLAPQKPEVFLKLAGGYSFFAERLCATFQELYPQAEEIPLEQYLESKLFNGHGEKYRGKACVMVTDVITTARSSLEAHTKATLRGIRVLAWATLIDRTFGPGPVPVISAFTGAPVRLLTQIG